MELYPPTSEAKWTHDIRLIRDHTMVINRIELQQYRRLSGLLQYHYVMMSHVTCPLARLSLP